MGALCSRTAQPVTVSVAYGNPIVDQAATVGSSTVSQGSPPTTIPLDGGSAGNADDHTTGADTGVVSGEQGDTASDVDALVDDSTFDFRDDTTIVEHYEGEKLPVKAQSVGIPPQAKWKITDLFDDYVKNHHRMAELGQAIIGGLYTDGREFEHCNLTREEEEAQLEMKRLYEFANVHEQNNMYRLWVILAADQAGNTLDDELWDQETFRKSRKFQEESRNYKMCSRDHLLTATLEVEIYKMRLPILSEKGNKPGGFRCLPAEIRNKVYEYVLDDDQAIKFRHFPYDPRDHEFGHQMRLFRRQQARYEGRDPYDPNHSFDFDYVVDSGALVLTHINHQTRLETHQLWLERMTFDIQLDQFEKFREVFFWNNFKSYRKRSMNITMPLLAGSDDIFGLEILPLIRFKRQHEAITIYVEGRSTNTEIARGGDSVDDVIMLLRNQNDMWNALIDVEAIRGVQLIRNRDPFPRSTFLVEVDRHYAKSWMLSIHPSDIRRRLGLEDINVTFVYISSFDNAEIEHVPQAERLGTRMKRHRADEESYNRKRVRITTPVQMQQILLISERNSIRNQKRRERERWLRKGTAWYTASQTFVPPNQDPMEYSDVEVTTQGIKSFDCTITEKVPCEIASRVVVEGNTMTHLSSEAGIDETVGIENNFPQSKSRKRARDSDDQSNEENRSEEKEEVIHFLDQMAMMRPKKRSRCTPEQVERPQYQHSDKWWNQKSNSWVEKLQEVDRSYMADHVAHVFAVAPCLLHSLRPEAEADDELL